jgi:hypothetical protein
MQGHKRRARRRAQPSEYRRSRRTPWRRRRSWRQSLCCSISCGGDTTALGRGCCCFRHQRRPQPRRQLHAGPHPATAPCRCVSSAWRPNGCCHRSSRPPGIRRHSFWRRLCQQSRQHAAAAQRAAGSRTSCRKLEAARWAAGDRARLAGEPAAQHAGARHAGRPRDRATQDVAAAISQGYSAGLPSTCKAVERETFKLRPRLSIT